MSKKTSSNKSLIVSGDNNLKKSISKTGMSIELKKSIPKMK